ncbi:uncharacterized protein LOC106157962 [Lingula anatina]|uniref:Uncharacterized protein LOC106157962 n=1 Tax=Lingula anatina TaxID=7574 RepID=A0A1S3HT84_LINAN|nr:uncharacterized protein LOC106157962 [Lingula anatina]XP_013389232.1 uncharacterized protein LOC106157962 [Lingula anatina]XP_013389233.1 uncharacterized protein LOC106157962 [Lingula anatina]XP_013389234.1 uncharacterized protein LOC106157962 [Lingula anatina]|eukprot:XP_013389231.1 uncharacterized protein LOC106157962 [Lingula anatina]
MSRLNISLLSSCGFATRNKIFQRGHLPAQLVWSKSNTNCVPIPRSVVLSKGITSVDAYRPVEIPVGYRAYSRKGRISLNHQEEEEVDLALEEHPEEELGLFMERMRVEEEEDAATKQKQVLPQVADAVEEDKSFLEEYFAWGLSQNEDGQNNLEYDYDDELEHEIEIMLHIDTHKENRKLVDALCKMNPSFNKNRERLSQQVAVLLRIGCKGGDILEFYEREPELIKVDTKRWEEVIDALHFTKFDSFQILQLIDDDIDIMKYGRDHMYNVFSLLRSFGIDHSKINSVVLRCPELLTTPTKTLLTNFHQLKTMFTNRHQRVIILRSPGVMVAQPEDTKAIYDYVLNTMKLEVKDMLLGRLFDHSLDHVRKRHQFLLRAGVYHTPGKATVSEHHHGNPNLKLMLDTSDRAFSEDVAGLTFEEYKVFCKMMNAEFEEENLERDGSNDGSS